MLNWIQVSALMSFSVGLWSKIDAHIPHLIYYYYRILTCSFKRLILRASTSKYKRVSKVKRILPAARAEALKAPLGDHLVENLSHCLVLECHGQHGRDRMLSNKDSQKSPDYRQTN